MNFSFTFAVWYDNHESKYTIKNTYIIQLTNKITKMTLTDHYKNLPEQTAPKSGLVVEICRRCEVRHQTVYHWVNKGVTPSSKEHCDTIAEIVGHPATELFPDYVEKN